MATTQHTPGPWEQRTCYDNGEPVEYAVEGKHPEHEGPIATVHITVDNDAEDYQNALLIAAAPDLAEALLQIATYDPNRLDAATLGNIARAALAKATGE